MDLRGEGGFFRWSTIAWDKVLDLADAHGWERAGTLAPVCVDEFGRPFRIAGWDGSYDTNDGQVVLAEDAAALACALESALDDIPDFECGEKLVEMNLGSVLTMEMDNPDLTPAAFFSGPDKERLAEFILFCRAGAFEIK